jgi:hypothetical protein
MQRWTRRQRKFPLRERGWRASYNSPVLPGSGGCQTTTNDADCRRTKPRQVRSECHLCNRP